MTTIEEDFKALIDAATWTAGSQGITKSTHIWVRDHAQDLNLNKPAVVSPNQVYIIESSVSSIINQSDASKLVEYIGFLVAYSKDPDEMELGLDLLDTIFDAEDFLNVTFDGINGNPKVGDYNNRAVWRWRKLRSK